MEQHGYDVTYISNADTHAGPAGLLRAKAFLSVGIDHRLVDGALGGQFLERIRHYLEKFETWILF